MIKHLRPLMALALWAAGAGLPVWASFVTADPPPTDSWAGEWKDKSGATLLVASNNGMLDVQGYDGRSVFRMLCVTTSGAPGKARCIGDGVSKVEEAGVPMRFIYRSEWSLSKDGTLSEVWEADYPKGSTKGASEFKRTPEAKGR